LKGKLRYASILAVVLLVSLVYFTVLSTQGSDIVSAKELANYAQAYLREYKKIAEENMHLVHDIDDIFFKYNHNPTRIVGHISREHGTAIEFDYSSTEETDSLVRVIDKAIEYQFWPNMSTNLQELQIVKVLASESPYVLDSQIIIRNYALLLVSEGASLYYIGEKESPFHISGPGAAMIFGKLVSRSGLILKGANSKQAWSVYQAGLDALELFFWESEGKLNETIVKQVEIQHKKPLLLEKIKENLNNKYYGEHPDEFYDHFNELQQIGLSDEIKASLWNRYSDLKREPDFTEKVLAFLVQTAPQIVGTTILTTVTSVMTILLANWLKAVLKKKWSR